MTMSSETISLTELRPRLSELVERAHERYDRFVITRHGRAEAVLLASDEFEGLLETIEVLSDERQVERLIEAEEELAAGGGFALDEIRAELELEGS
jgi:antitoxin YefM